MLICLWLYIFSFLNIFFWFLLYVSLFLCYYLMVFKMSVFFVKLNLFFIKNIHLFSFKNFKRANVVQCKRLLWIHVLCIILIRTSHSSSYSILSRWYIECLKSQGFRSLKTSTLNVYTEMGKWEKIAWIFRPFTVYVCKDEWCLI